MAAVDGVCAVFLDYRIRHLTVHVPHTPLMRELQDVELPINLLAWISDYLTLRKQQVIVDRATSSQYSVASVFLKAQCWETFALFINGITEVGISTNSYRVLYADDAQLYRGISQPEKDLHKVQSDIDELQRWSEEQLLQINPSKSKYYIIIISKKYRINCVLHLRGTTLGEMESFKYLGVLLHKHLTWSEHCILDICNKAKQILGLIIYR